MPFASYLSARVITLGYDSPFKSSSPRRILIYFSWQALKLAERTIQFSDTMAVLSEGYIRAARVSHAEGHLPQAAKYFSIALEKTKNPVAAIGLAQVQMKKGV